MRTQVERAAAWRLEQFARPDIVSAWQRADRRECEAVARIEKLRKHRGRGCRSTIRPDERVRRSRERITCTVVCGDARDTVTCCATKCCESAGGEQAPIGGER